MISTIASVLGIFFLIGGVLFMFLASLGLLRMTDTYSRSHTASLAPTLGKIGILLSIAFLFTEGDVTAKALLIVVFIFVTAPIAAHLIVRAAYRDKVPLADNNDIDDYKGV